MHNEEQIAYWNGDAGRKWAQKDDVMSTLLAPIARDLMAHCDPAGARALLDVGCGGGSETVLLAERAGAPGRVLGVDVSRPLLEVAERRRAGAGAIAERIAFLEADAASHRFEAGGYDFLFSRFGVMFFADPPAAFGNLRGALAPGARLAFACWQRLEDNPWTLLPLQAALEHLPAPPAPAPDAPGPFAFADPDRVRRLLAAAGFTAIAIEHHPVTMVWGGNGDLAGSVRALLNMGPVGRLLAEHDEAARDRVYGNAERVLAPYFENGALRLPGATWFVTARNP